MTIRTSEIFLRLLTFPILFVLVFSCQSEDQNESQKPWEFEIRKVEKKSCVGEDCASVSISYPFFQEQKLQTLIDRMIVQGISFEDQPDTLSLDATVQDFLEAFTNLKADFPDANSWEYAMDARVSFRGDSLLSLVFDSFSYTGGAHPNTFRSYLNFDMVGIAEITNSELILDEKTLLSKVEAEFRKHHEVEAGKSLKGDGRFFLNEKDEFFLPVAIGFEQDSLVLYYNSYEIGPYVMGPTEIKIPRSELAGIVTFGGKN